VNAISTRGTARLAQKASGHFAACARLASISDAPSRDNECKGKMGFFLRGLFRQFTRDNGDGSGVNMRQVGAHLLAVGCGIALTGCGTLPPPDSTVSETRMTRPASDPSKTLTVPEGMVWYATASRSSGLRFPPGTYALEAEDDDYWYFRSPSPLEFRSFANGKPNEEHTALGGLMLGKRSLRSVPAAGYVDAGLSKTMIWKLGGDFLAMEGRQWRKSF